MSTIAKLIRVYFSVFHCLHKVNSVCSAVDIQINPSAVALQSIQYNTIQYNPLFTQATFRINKSSLKHVRAKKWKQSGLLMTINKREQMTKM